MDKFFAVFGKFIFALAALAILVGGGYYLGQQRPSAPNPAINSSQPSPSAGAITTEAPAKIPTPTSMPKKTVTAGLGASSGLSFTMYSIEVPSDWTVTTDNQPSVPIDTLILTKAMYQIKIFQGATGGAMCLYPGSPSFEGPSSTFDNFVELTTPGAITLRRSGTTVTSGSTRGFTVCQKASDGTFQQPTPFGHISYKTPLSPDAATLGEMDAMIASLKKI